MPQTHLPRRRRRGAARGVAVAGVLLLAAACADGTGTDPDAPTEEEAVAELEELEDGDPGADAGTAEDPLADLEDPNDYVVDGVFAANGVVLPAPDGWDFDELAFASGVALALAPESEEQLAAEAVDPADLPQEVTFEEVVAANRDTVEQDPVVDEAVELPGARRAVQLRYVDLPSAEDAPEGQPAATSVVLLVAERDDGVLGVFNYAAASADFDEEIADLLLATAGFDPDSDPASPAPPPAG